MSINTNQNQNQGQGTLRVPWLTIGLTCLMVELYAGPPRVFDVLIFNKNAIGQGEFWRILTGHFVHCSWEHLFWDLLAFVILGAVIEIHRRRDLLPSLFLSCLAVSLWLFCGEPQLTTYCGLSGALNGILVIAALILWKQTDNKMYIMVILATVMKIIFEFTTHLTLFTNLSWQCIPGAHAAGIFLGLCYGMWRGISYNGTHIETRHDQL